MRHLIRQPILNRHLLYTDNTIPMATVKNEANANANAKKTPGISFDQEKHPPMSG